MEKKSFNITQGMVLLLLKPLDLPPKLVLNLIIYITDPKKNIGYKLDVNWLNYKKIIIKILRILFVKKKLLNIYILLI